MMQDMVRQVLECESASVCREIAATQQQLVAEVVPVAIFATVGLAFALTAYEVWSDE